MKHREKGKGMKTMKSLQMTLQNLKKQNKRFKERHEAMRKEILNHPEIVQFLRQHPEINEQTVEKRLNRLYEYMSQSNNCAQCESLQSCTNLVQGLTPRLQEVNGDIQLTYEKCDKLLHYENVVEKRELIKSLYMPREILNAKIDNLYIDSSRKNAITAIDQFLEVAQQRLPRRGIFFSGPFGVGKTYFLGAIANELQSLHISSTLIYMPEFVRQINAAIGTNTVQEKINIFKNAEVLMLDDIGAENLSAWFRDEVLGAILQYRMMEGLPVFFTSNYTMEQLEEVIATTSRGTVEKVKAGRIMERIKQLSTEVIVGGKNHRNE